MHFITPHKDSHPLFSKVVETNKQAIAISNKQILAHSDSVRAPQGGERILVGPIISTLPEDLPVA